MMKRKVKERMTWSSITQMMALIVVMMKMRKVTLVMKVMKMILVIMKVTMTVLKEGCQTRSTYQTCLCIQEVVDLQTAGDVHTSNNCK